MSYCDTCSNKYSDICGGCETLNGAPVWYSPSPSDVRPIKDDGIIWTFNYATGKFTPIRKGTNAYRIRVIWTDEEIAEFLGEHGCVDCTKECEEAHCETCWLEWLREEAT